MNGRSDDGGDVGRPDEGKFVHGPMMERGIHGGGLLGRRTTKPMAAAARVVMWVATFALVACAGEDSGSAECEPPSDPDAASWPVRLALAGSRPVVTYWCGDPSPRMNSVTVVYDPDGGKTVEVAGSTLLVADQGRVLLDPAQRGPRGGTYVLDLEALNLARIDAKLHSFPVGLGGGLLMWANGVAPLP
jgi:hypothetical protein